MVRIDGIILLDFLKGLWFVSLVRYFLDVGHWVGGRSDVFHGSGDGLSFLFILIVRFGLIQIDNDLAVLRQISLLIKFDRQVRVYFVLRNVYFLPIVLFKHEEPWCLWVKSVLYLFFCMSELRSFLDKTNCTL